MWRWYITINLIHFLILDSDIVLNEKNFEGICIERRKLYYLYEKVVYEIFNKVLVGAVNVASSIIWKSKLYIYAEGQ